jgi:hypothetical protein
VRLVLTGAPFPSGRSDMQLYQKFETFHRENPHVYRTLVALAREWVRTTRRTEIGIAMLYERVRWEIAIATSDPDFKLTNSYRAFYARLIMQRESDLRGLFTTRSSVADEWDAGAAA